MENINVALRVRPLNHKETEIGEEDMWLITKGNTIKPNQGVLANKESLQVLTKSKTRKKFIFDQCYNPFVQNQQMYNRSVKHIILSSLQGINGTIFMYGQTGAGKTFSMLGSHKYNQDINEETNSNNESVISSNVNLKQQQRSTNLKNSKSPLRKQSTLRRAVSPISSKFTNTTNASNSNTESKYRHSRMKSDLSNNNNTNQQQNINQSQHNINYQQQQQTPVIQNVFDINSINEQSGILVLSLAELFQKISEDFEKTYMLTIEYVEIYNDKIYDLLGPVDQLDQQLYINEDSSKKEFYIKGVTQKSVNNINEILYYLEMGERNRHYAATRMNHNSSRSHTIFRLQIKSVTQNYIKEQLQENRHRKQSNVNNAELLKFIHDEHDSDDEEAMSRQAGVVITEALLNFVDLAGSEKVSNHYNYVNEDEEDVQNEDAMVRNRVTEGKHINSSLFFLTLVIQLKSQGKSQHIPYRNSPLTKILRSSLGGNSRTLIVLCITPAHSQFEQTMSTLRFGANAKTIQNKVVANVQSQGDSEAYKYLVNEYEQKFKKMDQQLIENQEIIKDLNNQLETKESEHDKLKREIRDLQQQNQQQQEKIKYLENQMKMNQFMGSGGRGNNNLQNQQGDKVFDENEFITQMDDQVFNNKTGIIMINQKDRKQMVRYNLVKQRMKSDWQDMIYDCEGRMVMKCYQKRRDIDQLYDQVVSQQNDYIHQLNDKLKQYYTQKEEAKIYINQMSDQMDQFYDQYDHLYEKYSESAIELTQYKDQQNLQHLDVQELQQMQDRMMTGFKKVYELMIIKQNQLGSNSQDCKQEVEQEIDIQLDIEPIEKIEIDSNYKINGQTVQSYAQNVKQAIAQIYQTVQKQVQIYQEPIQNRDLKFKIREMKEMESKYILQILNQFNDINKNKGVFINPQKINQSELMNEEQQTVQEEQQTFLQKEMSEKENNTIQDVSLIQKQQNINKSEIESQQDISQFFRQDIKDLLYNQSEKKEENREEKKKSYMEIQKSRKSQVVNNILDLKDKYGYKQFNYRK